MKITRDKLSKLMFVLVLIGSIYSFGDLIFSEKQTRNEKKDVKYSKISKGMRLLNEEVDSVSTHMGFTQVKLKYLGFYTIPPTRNYDYNEEKLFNFLHIGDEISKEVNSDTLIIVRENERYLFVIGKYLNKND